MKIVLNVLRVLPEIIIAVCDVVKGINQLRREVKNERKEKEKG